jgi:hypothetical protein
MDNAQHISQTSETAPKKQIQVLSFIISTGSKLYSKLAFHKRKYKKRTLFLGSNDKAHLNLITCDGVWDVTKKSYSKRLVVFADIAD